MYRCAAPDGARDLGHLVDDLQEAGLIISTGAGVELDDVRDPGGAPCLRVEGTVGRNSNTVEANAEAGRLTIKIIEDAARCRQM